MRFEILVQNTFFGFTNDESSTITFNSLEKNPKRTQKKRIQFYDIHARTENTKSTVSILKLRFKNRGPVKRMEMERN